MRIPIIKTSAFGDIIHALPMLDYSHQVVPGFVADWAEEEPFSEHEDFRHGARGIR